MNYQQSTLRIALMVVLCFVLLDIFLAVTNPPHPCEMLQQISDSSMETCINYIKKHPEEYKEHTFFFGDSTLQSKRVYYTNGIPSLYGNIANQPVLNFAADGSNIHEVSLLIQELAPYPKEIFFVIKHTDYQEDKDNSIKNSFINTLESSPQSNTAETWIKKHILYKWKLYFYRSAINWIIFEDHPRKYLYEQYSLIEYFYANGFNISLAAEKMNSLFYSPFSAYDNNQQRKLLDRFREQDRKVNIKDVNDPNLEYINQIKRVAKTNLGTRFIAYTAPYSHEIANKYDLINWKRYNHTVGVIQEVLESNNVKFINLNNDADIQNISANYYHDFLHPLQEATPIIANTLYRLQKDDR